MSITVQQNINLKALNTLGLDVTAEYYVSVSCMEELQEALVFAKDKQLGTWVLGGGSNVVLRHSIPGLCVHISINTLNIKGPRVVVGAGMDWHQLVTSTLRHSLYGLENLSLIPGQAGAAPIQNIGAYGVELAEKLVEVRAQMISTGESITLSRSDCEFGYRQSVFKSELRDSVVITSLVLALETEFQPRLEYNGISQYIEEHQLSLSAESVSQAVCAIRIGKLPDPGKIGNVGSFFKNPLIDEITANGLKERDSNLPMHKQPGGGYKLSAAYLIEAAGLKGVGVGGATISAQHSLVIQNERAATFEDVMSLARKVQQTIYSQFDINLDIEPRIFPD